MGGPSAACEPILPGTCGIMGAVEIAGLAAVGAGVAGRVGMVVGSGGTWLATNEAGVVAGLTNRPLRDGPDTAKRSRGELPLALARHPTAAAAVDAFGAAIDPSAFNPSWLLVPDRHDAFFVDVTGTSVYSPATGAWEFRAGPVFANVLLVDEVNRASPRTQAAHAPEPRTTSRIPMVRMSSVSVPDPGEKIRLGARIIAAPTATRAAATSAKIGVDA